MSCVARGQSAPPRQLRGHDLDLEHTTEKKTHAQSTNKHNNNTTSGSRDTETGGEEETDGLFHPLLEITMSSEAGRGLRSKQDIPAGTVLFVAPTIRVPAEQYHQHCRHTVFEDYLFVGKTGDYHLALHLGRCVHVLHACVSCVSVCHHCGIHCVINSLHPQHLSAPLLTSYPKLKSVQPLSTPEHQLCAKREGQLHYIQVRAVCYE